MTHETRNEKLPRFHTNCFTLDSFPADALFTRKQTAEKLNACGVPISEKTLSTKACRGGGPAYCHFFKATIYRRGDVVDWVRSTMGAPACSTSERKLTEAIEGTALLREEECGA